MRAYNVRHDGVFRVVEAPSFGAAVDTWRAHERRADDQPGESEADKDEFWNRQEPESVVVLSEEPVIRAFVLVPDGLLGEGAARIGIERLRQLTAEGYDPAHDDEHSAMELARAAEAYLGEATGVGNAKVLWPWPDGFKPGTPIRNLEKAGALIAAEIDRRLRAGESA